jgi:YrbI family 3-deoxy-D-manno-octulosonate 8-phosphate phosphatase
MTKAPSNLVIAVIPARGGSRGIPAKNVQRVGGVPLVARAVLSARRANLIDTVFVSTDDAVIADIAVDAGADIIDRPIDLASDEASSESALLHALDDLARDGSHPDILVFIQATSPFIDPSDLDDAIERVAAGESDAVFSAVETHSFLWGSSRNGMTGVNHDASVRLRRQDREPQFRETGAFYVMRVDGFRSAQHRFFGKVGVTLVDSETAVDIDTPGDLVLARALASRLRPPALVGVDAVVTDFDGVHTDNRVRVDERGVESVVAHRGDGLGVSRLKAAGIPVLILSTEENPVVAARARKLQIDARHGIADKAEVLRDWARAQNIPLSRIAYLGNDINDLGCLDLVGWPVAVADAHPDVLPAARLILTHNGGDGAVRELADRILERTQS